MPEGALGEPYRAPTPLLVAGPAGNVVLLAHVIHDDPHSLIWCAALLGLGVVLFALQRLWGTRQRAAA